MKKNRLFNSDGYTLIEIVVVLAIIGIFTMTLVGSGTSNIAIERFSGNVNEFANAITEAEVNAYSSQVGSCAEGADCYWRGNVLEYSVGGDLYRQYLLLGQDISRFSNNIDQRLGLTGKQIRQEYRLTDIGLNLSGIGSNCNLADLSSNVGAMCASTHGELSLALLAPDGRAYTADQHYVNASPGNPNAYDPNVRAYDQEVPVTFVLEDEATSLVGYVTYDPKNGSIDTRVQ
ncbi:MAG: type II secretion system protein [Candidatus Saccharimonadales bacterium]